METFSNHYASKFYAVLRIVSGLLFAMHGAQKLTGFPGDGSTVRMASLMGLAGALELTLGLLIAAGLFARVAAFLASGEMAVAYFMAHASRNPFPLLNGGELAVLYCFLFLYVSARGAGEWSLESSLGRGAQRGRMFSFRT